jgi:hypothetical protein
MNDTNAPQRYQNYEQTWNKSGSSEDLREKDAFSLDSASLSDSSIVKHDEKRPSTSHENVVVDPEVGQ